MHGVYWTAWGPRNWILTHYDVSIWWVLKAARRLEQCRPRSSSEAAVLQRRLYEERRRSADGQISMEKEQHTLHRQHSLRRHRWYCFQEGENAWFAVKTSGFLLNFRASNSLWARVLSHFWNNCNSFSSVCKHRVKNVWKGLELEKKNWDRV